MHSQIKNNLRRMVFWAGLFAFAFGDLGWTAGQEPNWTPARSSEAPQRLQDQVAARRPGGSTSPVESAGYQEIFLDEFADQEPQVILDQETTYTYDHELPPLDDPLHSFCDCPECSRGEIVGARPLYELLGQLNGCGWWVTADYLLWSFDGMDLPTLLTTSPAGTSPANTGVLGLNGTSALVGGTLGDDFRSGGRLKVGFWLDPSRQTSWEASYLGFDSDQHEATFNSASRPNLSRPFFDTLSGNESSLLLAHSSFLTGASTLRASTELQAFEVVRRQQWWSDDIFNIDFLLGYKHGDLDEFLRIDDSSTYQSARGPILAGTNIRRFDQFEVENSFDGLVLGLDRRHLWRGWLIGYTGKVSLGANQARVRIDGRTTTTVPSGGGTSIASGGLLAQASNIGTFRRDEFAVIPEFEFLVRRQVTDRVRLHAGYSVVYWSSAARVADTLSRRVSQLPPEPISGTAEPRFTWSDNGFFAHGFQFGLDYKF